MIAKTFVGDLPLIVTVIWFGLGGAIWFAERRSMRKDKQSEPS